MSPAPVTIAVAGGTGSGKTTIANEIVKRVGADRIAYIQHDSYYFDWGRLPLDPRTRVGAEARDVDAAGRRDEHEPRDPVGLVDLQNAFGELDRFLDLAVRQHRQEGATEKLVVARVTAERRNFLIAEWLDRVRRRAFTAVLEPEAVEPWVKIVLRTIRAIDYTFGDVLRSREETDPRAVAMRVLGSEGGELTVAEVARRLRVSRATVYKFVADGRLPHVRVGNSIRLLPHVALHETKPQV